MSNLGNKEIMAKNIRYYMDKTAKDRNQICKDLSFKYSTFTEWVNGNKYPRIDKIEILANYFGINKSDLIEDKVRQPSVRQTAASASRAGNCLSLTKEELEHMRIYRHLDKADKANINRNISFLLTDKKYTTLRQGTVVQ